MAEYFAVVKMLGATIPQKVNFTAADSYGDAITGLTKAAGVGSTSAFSEFEIHKVVENGNAYVPIAYRGPKKERKGVARLVKPSEPTEKTSSSKALAVCCAVTVPEEESYVPYKVVVG